MSAKMIVDTSSILFALSNRMDAFRAIEEADEDYEPVVTSGVVTELKDIGKGRGKQSMNARAALSVMKERSIEVIAAGGVVDDSILSAAKRFRCSVCTNDIGLKRRLKASGVKAVSIGRDRKLR